ncbi:hypothetical protein C1T17_20175 (plasmid) [Sphingobium sp. SCG-1]|nr:hypothetical protein C1T17_20175 [Sphingobium sp. SCG-1]
MAICLSIGVLPVRFATMTALSARSHVPVKGTLRMRLSALLAILALFGMLALANWHDAMPHDHDADHVVSLETDHHGRAPGEKPDQADLMHMAAHVVLQTVVVPAPPVVTAGLAPVALNWILGTVAGTRSLAPLSILRPPRG